MLYVLNLDQNISSKFKKFISKTANKEMVFHTPYLYVARPANFGQL